MLKRDLVNAITQNSGARIVKAVQYITGCDLIAAFTIRNAIKEVIEVDKFPYFAKTRDGKEVVVLRVREENVYFPLVGIIIEENNTMKPMAWTTDGHFLASDEENPNDLVKE